MHNNFKSIIYVAGHFGIIGREHAEALIYKGKYGYISANRTFSKLEREYKLLKRIDRGKRKADAYRLTHQGVKYFRKEYGYEPKFFNSGDRLSHSIYILNFYVKMVTHIIDQKLIEDNFIIKSINQKISFKIQKQISFLTRDKNKIIEPDAFSIFKYKENRAKVFYLEIENSERKSANIARKTLENYEAYFLSNKWKKEKWQNKDKKIFPLILIIAYSDFKVRELIRWFNKKIKVEQLKYSYYFLSYSELKQGISGKVWHNLDGDKVNLF